MVTVVGADTEKSRRCRVYNVWRVVAEDQRLLNTCSSVSAEQQTTEPASLSQLDTRADNLETS